MRGGGGRGGGGQKYQEDEKEEEGIEEEKASAEGARAATQPQPPALRTERALGPPAGLAWPAGDRDRDRGGGAISSSRPQPASSRARLRPTALRPPAEPRRGSRRTWPGPDSSLASGGEAWGRGESRSSGLAMALLPSLRGGRREGAVAGTLRAPPPQPRPSPPRPGSSPVHLSGLGGPLPAGGFTWCSLWDSRGPKAGWGASPESPRLGAGWCARSGVLPGRSGEGLRGRCPRAWRGVCARSGA